MSTASSPATMRLRAMALALAGWGWSAVPPLLLVLAASALLPILVSCRDDVESPTGPTLATPNATVAAAASLSFLQVTAGGGHTCGVATDNRAYCWGRNDFGQVGDGTTTQRLRATPVAAPQ